MKCDDQANDTNVHVTVFTKWTILYIPTCILYVVNSALNAFDSFRPRAQGKARADQRNDGQSIESVVISKIEILLLFTRQLSHVDDA